MVEGFDRVIFTKLPRPQLCGVTAKLHCAYGTTSLALCANFTCRLAANFTFSPSVPSTASGPPSLSRNVFSCTIQSMHDEGTALYTQFPTLSLLTGRVVGHLVTLGVRVFQRKIICNEGIARSEAFLRGMPERLAFGRCRCAKKFSPLLLCNGETAQMGSN